MLKAFNEALNRQKQGRSEPVFASEDFGVIDDTLRAYRKGQFPKGIDRLVRYPELLEALAADARAIQASQVAPALEPQLTAG